MIFDKIIEKVVDKKIKEFKEKFVEYINIAKNKIKEYFTKK